MAPYTVYHTVLVGMNFDPVKYVKEILSRVGYTCEMNFDPLLIFDAIVEPTVGSKVEQTSTWSKKHFWTPDFNNVSDDILPSYVKC